MANVRKYLRVYLFTYLSIYLFIYLLTYLFIYLFISKSSFFYQLVFSFDQLDTY